MLNYIHSAIAGHIDRRRFLGAAATTIAAASPLGLFGSVSSGVLSSLSSATGWINSQPLTAADLAGKVILIDFWTYTCINWLRTFPYVDRKSVV